MLSMWKCFLFGWEMLALPQAAIGQLLAGGLVNIPTLHKVPHLVTEHQDAVAQWQVSHPATCHGADLKLQLQMHSHIFQLQIGI